MVIGLHKFHTRNIIVLLLLAVLFSRAQNIDSLKAVLKLAKDDSTRCYILNQLTEVAPDEEWPVFNLRMKELSEKNLKQYPKEHALHKTFSRFLAASLNNLGYGANLEGKFPEAILYFTQSVKIQGEIGDKEGEATSYNNLGQSYSNKGDMHKAMECHKLSLKLREELGNKTGIAQSFNNLGYVYENLGDIPNALEHLEKSLKIREEIGDKQGIAYTLNNLAWIYGDQGYNEKSLEYYRRSLSLREELGDARGVGRLLNNIGLYYDKLGDKTKAYKYYMKSLKTMESLGDKQGIGYALNNLATIFGERGDLKKALDYFNKSLKLREELGDQQGIAESLNSIGGAYLKLKKYALAEDYNLRSLQIAKKLGLRHNIQAASGTLNRVYKARGDFKNALEYFELFVAMRDSITNEETRKASVKTQLKYEYGKKIAADSIARAREKELGKIRIAKQEADLVVKKNQQYALFGGLALVFVFGIFMLNRVVLAQKQKKVIEFQKEVVEEKQKEILDSIHYAKRIQKALFTGEKYIEKNLARLKK